MKKYITMILAALMVMGLAGCNDRSTLPAPAEQEGSYTQIRMDEAVTMMEEETDYIILDVRTPEEFAEAHIPNAINVPNEVIGEDAIPELPKEDQMIFVYCRSGNRSKQASEKLVNLGYTNVYEFGGIIDWLNYHKEDDEVLLSCEVEGLEEALTKLLNGE